MDDAQLAGLPPGIAAAWGLRSRPSRGPKPALSLDRIVAAAVKIADAEGLGGVSMSRLAAELGTGTMSLYRYISAKDELYALMIDAAGGNPPAPPSGAETWRDGLTRWAVTYLALLNTHPWIVRIPIDTPPLTPNQVAWMESGLQSLRGTGLQGTEKLSTIMLLSAFVRSWAQITDDITTAAVAAGVTPDEAMEGYSRLLTALVDERDFPAVSNLMRHEIPASEPDAPDADFQFGLAVQLDGLDVLVRRRAGEPPA